MSRSKKVLLLCSFLVAVNLAVGAFYLLRRSSQSNPEVVTPTLALDSINPKSLYFTPGARSTLLLRKPQFSISDDKDDHSARTIAFARAAQNPKIWRELDRKYQFDTCLLSGDTGQYRPLLQYLLEARDWSLAYLDHTSLVFQRPPKKTWIPEDLQPIREKFSRLSAKPQTTFLVQLSGKLLAVHRYAEARACIDKAKQLSNSSPETWTADALYLAHFGQWPQALDRADQALAIDKTFLPALAAKAQILYSMHRSGEALPVSELLVKANPRDPQVLFLHAKIAHEAHAYTVEVTTLKSLIDLAEQEEQATSGYRIYLAQAYARDGQALPALEQFRLAQQDTDLSEEQRKFIEESVEQIKTHIQPQ